MEINVNLTPRQAVAWNYLYDSQTNEILYGGGAGGGKSWLGCAWLIINCLKYKGSRWLMGRAVLKALKESTLKTFLELINDWGLQGEIKYNSIDGYIRFKNGSEIMLKDLALYPSDPHYDSLGSTEYTGAFLDEASQIPEKAKDIVMSRMRYKLGEFDIIPKMLICSNPAKNFMYQQFFKPHRDGTIREDRAFIPALVTDNPNISPHYIKSLHKLDKLSKERLLYGNWDYDDNFGKLFDYDKIIDCFTNTFVEKGENYLTCDVARKGSDKCVITVWSGLRVVKMIDYDISLLTMIKQSILELSEIFNIPRSNIVIDEDGVGGGLVDELAGCRGFVNNSSPRNGENYSNLKSQCFFKFAELINKSEVYIDCNSEIKEKIIQDLEHIKQKDPDKDGKLAVIGKDKIKEITGRSTDYADSLMMRCIFELDRQSFDTVDNLDFLF